MATGMAHLVEPEACRRPWLRAVAYRALTPDYRPLTVQSAADVHPHTRSPFRFPRRGARRRARIAAEARSSRRRRSRPSRSRLRGEAASFVVSFPPHRSSPAAGPLAGFDPSGPLRPIRERAYLLRQNLLAWLGTGLIAFLGFFASFYYAADLLGPDRDVRPVRRADRRRLVRLAAANAVRHGRGDRQLRPHRRGHRTSASPNRA